MLGSNAANYFFFYFDAPCNRYDSRLANIDLTLFVVVVVFEWTPRFAEESFFVFIFLKQRHAHTHKGPTPPPPRREIIIRKRYNRKSRI